MGKRLEAPRRSGALAVASGSDRNAWRATERGMLPGGGGRGSRRGPRADGTRVRSAVPKAGAQQQPIAFKSITITSRSTLKTAC